MIKLDNTQKLLLASATLMLVLAIAPTTSAYAQSAVDVIFVVDESGSMVTEQAFIGTNLVPALEAAFTAANIGSGGTPNLYSAVGFAAITAPGQDPNCFNGITSPRVVQGPVASGAFAPAFCTVGSAQDGYDAMQFALSNINQRGGNVATQVILVTDEDRDIVDAGDTFANTVTTFQNANAGLNVIVCNLFQDANTNPAIGLFSPPAGTAYSATGGGGFTTSAPGSVVAAVQQCAFQSAPTVLVDYVNLAAALNGGAWDLAFISAGVNPSTSFANAFADAKVTEVQVEPIGGEILPISSVSLMLAGIQSSAIWMLPVLAGVVGTTAFYLKTRKN